MFNIMKRIIYCLVATFMLFTSSFKAFSESFVISSPEDAQAFLAVYPTKPTVASRATVDDFTITGTVTQANVNAIGEAIKTFNGDIKVENMTLEGAAAPIRLETLFADKTFNKGIIVRNNAAVNWIGAGLFPQEIKGDLIIYQKDLPFPGVDGWALNVSNFGTVRKVHGNYVLASVNNRQITHTGCFSVLEEVGKNFELYFIGQPWIWIIAAPRLETIGGDFIMKGPSGGLTTVIGDDGNPVRILVWSLQILERIKRIGGGVTVLNIPDIGMSFSGWSGGADDPNAYATQGYCWIRYLIDQRVIDYACNDVILGWEDDPIDLATLGGCFDGGTMDDPPRPLPAKDPDCQQAGIKKVVTTSFASVYPTLISDNLTIESNTALAKAEIFDMTGKSVMKISRIASGKKTVSVATLTKGIYTLKLTSVNNETVVYKIIK
jgi:hypothetical protein